MGSATNLRWSCQMRAEGIPRSRRVSPSFFRSLPARRVSTGGRPNCCVSALSLPRERSAPPLLMLAPTTDESGDSVYEFYNLAKKTAIHFKESRHVSNRDCTILGSAHGWLILTDSLGADVYLSDPVSRRHIKLPSLERFADEDGGDMRVILTSSPDDEESRVILSILPEHRLVSCSPGRSTAWTPLAPPESDEISKRRETDYYEEFAYSSGQKLLFCLTDWFVDVWDLSGHPFQSPRVNWMSEAIQFHPQPGRSQQESNLKQVIHKNGWLLRYLLVDQGSNELFLVARYVNPRMSSDGSYAKGIFFTKYRGWDFSLPYKTFDFEVYKVDLGGGELKLSYMEDCLNGMVMFVGKNYSFAVTASEHPELKPNSIYFVDDDDLNYGDYIWNDEDGEDTTECVWTDYGGHDNGVFEYEKKSFSSLCDLCPFDYQSIKRMSPAPLWFAPSF